MKTCHPNWYSRENPVMAVLLWNAAYLFVLFLTAQLYLLSILEVIHYPISVGFWLMVETEKLC